MRIKIAILSLCLLVHVPFFGSERIPEYNHPDILSFETMPKTVSHDTHSTLLLSDKHFKHLNKSLQWNWNAPNAYWSIHKDIGYTFESAKDKAFLPTFVFWVYAEEPLNDKTLKVEFLKNGEVKCWFDYKLGFTGWRGAWVGFGRDMRGIPAEGMNEVRFSVPGARQGTLFFDHIILSSSQDIRQHTADFQAPYINPETKNHWLILHKSWLKEFDIPLQKAVSKEQGIDLSVIEKRLETLLLKDKKSKSLSQLKEKFEEYKITCDERGNIKGIPIFFERYGETYEYLDAPRYNKIYANPMGLKNVNKTLMSMASSYHQANEKQTRENIAQMFILLTQHLLDQGFQAGSAMGTLHHLGYSMMEYYPAMFLMREKLQKWGLDKKVQQAMEWFAGTGEIKTDTKDEEMDIDAFNTSLIGRFSSIMMIQDDAHKTRYLKAFSRWVDQGFKYSEGTLGSFKSDGCIYHHRHNYPAYAVGGLTGAVQAVNLLRGTSFAISQESHQILKEALLAMRYYCNLRTWPLSLSGRHPDGKKGLEPGHFAELALAGSPDGKENIDTELASAFLRLSKPDDAQKKQFIKAGFSAEPSPTGNRTFPYSCLNIHRRDNWMVAAMGHSRYLWAAEIYRAKNTYGRYITHGALQILATGDPISNEGSGYRQEGWNWNHFPGTTATVFPLQQLKADVRNLDDVSGYEEMLLSDEAFAGGISLKQRQGAFGMKLHEHDKYNGSLRARKSFFFFDNRVVALGTNIESALPNPTHTTLFQVFLDKDEKPFYLNGTTITEFPYKQTISKKETVLSDGLNNYFFVKEGNVEFTKSNQHSFHEATQAPTQNKFALATINHGAKVKNGRYEYMILVQPSDAERAFYLKNNRAPYTVYRQDKSAHIVHDQLTQTTGYVLFEAGDINIEKLPVRATDIPCLIMTDTSTSGTITMSVADPDLRFYEGESDDIYDENNKRVERSVYSRAWKDNPSKPSTVTLTLAGKWKLQQPVDGVQVNSNAAGTTVSVTSREGKGKEFVLVKE